MKTKIILLIISIATIFGWRADAQLSFTTTVGGVPNVSGATLENFNEFSLPSILTLSGYSYRYSGGLGDPVGSTPPYYSGSTATFFGGSPVNGFDNSPYIVVLGAGSATLTFPNSQKFFGLCWGSVDYYNTLTFYDISHNSIGSITGGQIQSSGDVGDNGTTYVNIWSTVPFSEVIATTSMANNDFEFDDVAYAQTVPEPSTLVLCVLGVFATSAVARRLRSARVKFNNQLT